MTARRVTLVASEMLGLTRSGGLGTATSFLALALARAGREVSIVCTSSAPERMPPSWEELYRSCGVGYELLAAGRQRVQPADARLGYDVAARLRRDPPDVVIAQDYGGPAAQALRLRHQGLAFEGTRFVVFCHGSSVWFTEAIRKLHAANAPPQLELAERVSLALADAVVSPSAYMLGWLERRGWQLARPALVVPYVTRGAALRTAPPPAAGGGPVSRIAYFGRLDERKGVRAFLDGLRLVDRSLLAGVELCFLGEETKTWPAHRVAASLGELASVVRGVRIETRLDQPEALELLREPGTLAVMPSLVDNSPNTVYECLELGIPFLTGSPGGASEIVDERDRAACVIEPTPFGIARALARALTEGVRPARPSFDPSASVEAWLRLLDDVCGSPARALPPPADEVTVVAMVRSATVSLRDRAARLQAPRAPRSDLVVVDCRPAAAAPLEEGLPAGARVVRAAGASPLAARREGAAAARCELVLFLDEHDEPQPGLLERLVRAQAATGADVVTCGVAEGGREAETIRLFDGAARGAGALENRFGAVGLFRRSLVSRALQEAAADAPDPDWWLLARLSLEGAAICSVPEPLVRRADERASGVAALLPVLDAYERALPRALRALPRLAAADHAADPAPPRPTSLARRLGAAVAAALSSRTGSPSGRARAGG